MTTTLDLPAFNIVPPFEAPDGPNAGNLSVAGDGLEVLLSRFQPIAVGNYGNGPGAPSTYDGDPPSVFVPDGLPAGATLLEARWVYRAWRESSSDASGESWSGYTPTPATVPFIALDNNSSPDLFTLDDIPVGAYAAEPTVSGPDAYALDEAAARISRVRAWGTGTGAIHLDYLALRLTYTTPAPVRLLPRDDTAGASTSPRLWPPTKSNRLAGNIP